MSSLIYDLVAEALSRTLDNTPGVILSTKAKFTHFFFADDLATFHNRKKDYDKYVHHHLDAYEKATGCKLNESKCSSPEAPETPTTFSKGSNSERYLG